MNLNQRQLPAYWQGLGALNTGMFSSVVLRFSQPHPATPRLECPRHEHFSRVIYHQRPPNNPRKGCKAVAWGNRCNVSWSQRRKKDAHCNQTRERHAEKERRDRRTGRPAELGCATRLYSIKMIYYGWCCSARPNYSRSANKHWRLINDDTHKENVKGGRIYNKLKG
jgi:hypothetical protein